MKTADLEALLIDRSLGELPPGVEELLDAHLAHNPADAAAAREFTSTVRQAQSALPVATAGELPPIPAALLTRPAPASRPPVRELLKFAAVLALGLALGSQFHGRSPAPATSTAQTIAFAPVAAAPPRATAAGPFWSLTRVEAEARHQAAAPATNRLPLHWTSPFKMPRLESPADKS